MLTVALPVGAFLGLGALVTLAERIAPVRANRGRGGTLGIDTLALLSSAVVTAAGASCTEALLPVPAPWHAWVASVPAAVGFVAFVVLSDFSRFLAHRALHTAWLWPSHRFHHSVEQLDWYAGNRAAPLHALLFIVPTTGLAWATEIGPVGVAVNGVLMIFWNQLMHANVRLPDRLQRAAEWVVTTPRYHHVHHSVDPGHAHANLGSILTIWDRLAGTALAPDRVSPSALVFGLETRDAAPLARQMIGL